MVSGNVSKTAVDAVASIIVNSQAVKSVQSRSAVNTSDSFKNIMDISSGLTSGNSVQQPSKPTGDDLQKIQNNVGASTAGKITDAKKDDKAVKDDDQSIVEEISEGIESVIKEKLNMTDEEFADLMSQLGFTPLDLLNPQNLTDFVVAYTGAESSIDLLTDSNLSDMYKSLSDVVMNVISQTAEQTGMTVEDLTAVIEDFQKADKTVTDDTVPDVKIPVDNSVKDNNQVRDTIASNNNQNRADNDGKDVQKNSSVDKQEAAPEQNVAVRTEHTEVFEEESKSSMDKGSNKNSGENIMQNLVNAFGKAMETANVSAQPQVIDAQSVITQIVDAVKVTATQETSSMELQLQPENLGKVNLEVIAKDGAVTAKIVAENEAVKSVIENQITALKENLNNQGLKIEAVEVTVASHAFENGMNSENRNNNEQNNTSGNRRFRNFSELKEDDSNDVDTIEEQLQKANGGSVNYMA